MTSNINNSSWVLTTMYAPCTPVGKRTFLERFKGIQMPDQTEWLIIGDFNLIRKPEDRNKEGGDVNEMYLFNEAIDTLGLIELPLHGRHFTWTNNTALPSTRKTRLVFHIKCLDRKVSKYNSQGNGNENLKSLALFNRDKYQNS